MRFRRRVSKCPYLLGKGSPQTAPTFAVVPHHHPTGSVFPMLSAQLQPLWGNGGNVAPGAIVRMTRISLRMTRIERL